MEGSPHAVANTSAAELDRYREQADRFAAELDGAYYRHYAGLEETLDLEPIYTEHADLTTLERARSFEAGAGEDRSVRELWRFACEGHLGELTREHEERIARVEAGLSATVDTEEIPFRMLRPVIANEPDRMRRERLDAVRRELTEEHLNPIYAESAGQVREAVGRLGAPSYLELYRRFGFGLDAVAAECRELLDATQALWEDIGDQLFRERIGVGLDEAQRWDVARVARAPHWDAAFPAASMVPALEATLGDLGIDLGAQRNIELDLEQRPLKTPRAYCFPIEIPDRVVLMIQPIGGADDWRALFHEAGHAEHFGNTSASLRFEEKRLGDNAVTEGWAALFDRLVDDPAWLTRRLDMPRPAEFAREGAGRHLYVVRRYAAKLLYELELHATDDLAAMRGRYVELLGEAVRIEPAGEDFLADVDAGFYASSYLRSWALEAQLRTFLHEEFGTDWFRRREAGSLLRELWSEGQRPTADDLLRDVAGSELVLDAITERIKTTLSG